MKVVRNFGNVFRMITNNAIRTVIFGKRMRKHLAPANTLRLAKKPDKQHILNGGTIHFGKEFHDMCGEHYRFQRQTICTME